MDWYYHDGNGQVGPISPEEFGAVIVEGRVTGETHVWHTGMEGWKTLDQARPDWKKEFGEASPQALAAAGPQASCLECKRDFLQTDMVYFDQGYVCAGCKLTYVQKIREGLETGGALDYAGFWIRFVAKVIDGLIVLLIVGSLMVPFALAFGMGGMGDFTDSEVLFSVLSNGLINLVAVALGLAYDTWFVGKFQATPGKMACGLKIIMPDGGKITYLRAFGRSMGYLLSRTMLYIGCIIAAFDAEKRSLHDHICSTRVIRK